jgi:hypothetical protein
MVSLREKPMGRDADSGVRQVFSGGQPGLARNQFVVAVSRPGVKDVLGPGQSQNGLVPAVGGRGLLSNRRCRAGLSVLPDIGGSVVRDPTVGERR